MRHLTLQLNAKLHPMDRGEFYEYPICEALEAANCGCTDGGGTMMEKNGEIKFCDVEIELNDDSDECYRKLTEILDSLEIPKGSLLHDGENKTEIGTLEGMALYLNGTDLPDAVYETCDINYVVSELETLLGDQGRFLSHWQGPAETALYFYGASFAEMKRLISNFVSEYPLCEKSRITQIA